MNELKYVISEKKIQLRDSDDLVIAVFRDNEFLMPKLLENNSPTEGFCGTDKKEEWFVELQSNHNRMFKFVNGEDNKELIFQLQLSDYNPALERIRDNIRSFDGIFDSLD